MLIAVSNLVINYLNIVRIAWVEVGLQKGAPYAGGETFFSAMSHCAGLFLDLLPLAGSTNMKLLPFALRSRCQNLSPEIQVGLTGNITFHHNISGPRINIFQKKYLLEIQYGAPWLFKRCTKWTDNGIFLLNIPRAAWRINCV